MNDDAAVTTDPPEGTSPAVAAAGSIGFASRAHAQLPRAVAQAGSVASGHHLPGGQAGDGSRRRRPPQYPLPRLPGADGPGARARSAGHRDLGAGLGVCRRPGGDGQARAGRVATMPASCRARATSRAMCRSTRWPGASGEELWFVNTRFSCLCTFDRSASFTPRWRPPFVTALEPTDRCHLNGLGMVDGRPRYVTALGQTDSPGGWRPEKARGGIVMDVESGEVLAQRSFDAALAAVVRRAVVGLRVGGRNARVTSTRGPAGTRRSRPRRGLPAGSTSPATWRSWGSRRCGSPPFSAASRSPSGSQADERTCGVCVIDLVRGEAIALLRFEEGVQEVFAVQVLPGRRYPELINDDTKLLENSFVVPDAALADVPAVLRGAARTGR